LLHILSYRIINLSLNIKVIGSNSKSRLPEPKSVSASQAVNEQPGFNSPGVLIDFEKINGEWDLFHGHLSKISKHGQYSSVYSLWSLSPQKLRPM